MFKAKISGIEQAGDKIGRLHEAVSNATEATGAANSKFLVSSIGAWATGASGASLLIENNLHVVDYALLDLKTDFANAAGDLSGEISGLRDQVMQPIKGGTTDPDKVRYDAAAPVDARAAMAACDLQTMQTSLKSATNALNGLEDAGGIAAQLQSLGTALQDEATAIEQLRASYTAFAGGIDAFEAKYAAAMNPDEFIKESMVDKASGDMNATYSTSGLGTTVAFLGKVKGTTPKGAGPFGAYCTFGIKGLKSWSSLIGKTMDGFHKNKLWINPTYAEWGNKVQEGLGLFLPKQWNKAATDFAGAVKPAGDSANTVSSLMKKAGAGDAAGKFLQKADGVAKAGTKLKVFGRVLGWAGDAIEVSNIVGNSVKAYGTAKGDSSDKLAAAITTGTGGVAKFLITKGATAIGAACGGPVGAFVGTIVGEGLSWGIGKIAESDFFQGLKTGAANAVSDIIDAFTGGSQSAFSRTAPAM